MSDLLARLAARALGRLPTVQPRSPSRYEAAPTLAAEIPDAVEVSPAVSPAEAPAELFVASHLPAKPAAQPAAPLPAMARNAEAAESAAEREGGSAAVAENRAVRPEVDTATAIRPAQRPAPTRRQAAAAPERQRSISSFPPSSGAAGSRPAAQAVRRQPRPSQEPPLAVPAVQEPPPAVPAPIAAPRSAPALPPRLADPAAPGSGRERTGIAASETVPPSELPEREMEAPSRAEIPLERSPLVPRAAVREQPARPGTGLAAAGSPRERGPAAAAEPVVRVTIGRIEVRAAPPPPPAVISRPAAPRLTLEEYLRRRNEGRM